MKKVLLTLLSVLTAGCGTATQSKISKDYPAIDTSSVKVINVKDIPRVKKVSPPIHIEKLYDIEGTYPLGDIVFVDKNIIVVPYTKVKKLSEKEKEEYLEKRKEYLKKSPEELAEEVVKKEKGETELTYKLRKKLATLFFKWAKSNPDLFFKPPDYVATELGVKVIKLGERDYKILKTIPVITEELPTETSCSVRSGTLLVKKPVKVCRRWLGLDVYLSTDEKNIYFAPAYYKLKNFPTIVLDKNNFLIKGKINNISISSSIGKNRLKGYDSLKKKSVIGYVKYNGQDLEFIIEKEVNLTFGKVSLEKNRFLVNLRFPAEIYDLQKEQKIKVMHSGFIGFKDSIFYANVGIVKRTTPDLTKVKEKLVLCSSLYDDMSSNCMLGKDLGEYILFLYDKGVPARNPQTGKIYGSGKTYKAEIWAFDPEKKEKFKLINQEVEYHTLNFGFIGYNPETRTLVVLHFPDKISVYRLSR